MKVAKLLEMGSQMLKVMSENDIKMTDWSYCKLYEDYERMRHRGEKYHVIISELSLAYAISESSVSRIVKRLSRDVRE